VNFLGSGKVVRVEYDAEGLVTNDTATMMIVFTRTGISDSAFNN
jgi:hypothetical protein